MGVRWVCVVAIGQSGERVEREPEQLEHEQQQQDQFQTPPLRRAVRAGGCGSWKGKAAS